MQRNAATERNDVYARSTPMSILKTTMYRLFRTYEKPMVYAEHYLRIYRAAVDSVSYPVHVRGPPP